MWNLIAFNDFFYETDKMNLPEYNVNSYKSWRFQLVNFYQYIFL